MTGKRVWVAGGVVAMLAVAGAGVALLPDLIDTRDEIPAWTFVAQDSGFAQLLPEARESTDDVCPEAGCTWAVTSTAAVVMMFPTRDAAAASVAAAPGDAQQSHWIAIHFDASVPESERAIIMQGIDGLHVSG